MPPILAADPGRLGAAHPVVNRSQRQQTAGLADVAAALSQRAKLGGIIIVSKRNGWHGESPPNQP